MSAIDEILSTCGVRPVRAIPAAPARRVAVVTCMDARLDVLRMLGLRAGDAHVLRNAGGVVTDDVQRSLTVSQRRLGTREVMVIQHTGCGMLQLREEELAAEIERDTGQPPPFELGGFANLEASVRRSVERLASSRLLPHRAAVRGFVYELETGRLREVAAS